MRCEHNILFWILTRQFLQLNCWEDTSDGAKRNIASSILDNELLVMVDTGVSEWVGLWCRLLTAYNTNVLLLSASISLNTYINTKMNRPRPKRVFSLFRCQDIPLSTKKIKSVSMCNVSKTIIVLTPFCITTVFKWELVYPTRSCCCWP